VPNGIDGGTAIVLPCVGFDPDAVGFPGFVQHLAHPQYAVASTFFVTKRFCGFRVFFDDTGCMFCAGYNNC
jgi:hypothetical protein